MTLTRGIPLFFELQKQTEPINDRMGTMRETEIIEICKNMKKYRLRDKKTQREVAEGRDGTEYICSERTYGKIERAVYVPKIEIIVKLLERFNTTLQEELERVTRGSRVRFNNTVEGIGDLILKRAYEEATQTLEKLKKEIYYDRNLSINKQAILFLEGILIYEIKKDAKKSIAYLINGMKLTRGGLFKGKGDKIDISQVENNEYTLIEYKILFNIAAKKDYLGKRGEGIELSYAIIKSLMHENVEYRVRMRILQVTLFNLSNMLIDERRIDETIQVSTEGIEYCKELKTTKFIGGFYCNIAEAYMLKGDKGHAIEFFKRSEQHFIDEGENQKAERTKTYAFESFGLSI